MSDCLEIPGLRDLAVAEYSDWQQSQVNDEKLKAEFRKASDAALEDGLDLMQVHEDQDPEWVKRCKCNVEERATALFA
jgi:hypothetical protein